MTHDPGLRLHIATILPMVYSCTDDIQSRMQVCSQSATHYHPSCFELDQEFEDIIAELHASSDLILTDPWQQLVQACTAMSHKVECN